MTTTLVRRPSGNRSGLSSIFSIDPFNDLRGEFDQMLSNWFEDNQNAAVPSFVPSLDLKETDASYEIHADLPGIKPNEIDVKLTDNVLTISGERKCEKTECKEKGTKNGATTHLVERFYGTFSRSIMLPGNVKKDKVDAQYRDGVLSVIVPKAEECKPCQITVKT